MLLKHEDLAKADKKRDKQIARHLKEMDRKVSAVTKDMNDLVRDQQKGMYAWVRKRLGLEDDGLLWRTEPTVAQWVNRRLNRELFEHEIKHHGASYRRP
ncbi:MAG: hypothetical protein OXN89_05015 [Bryobacterales bacterium]|nr:hypothetical protein [Bryobacterales bacterium]